ncbi:MAG: MMPL family transporter, partial [Actinomycetota bacterium]|nr:MMPL family transporter [Actinomycetota bacterium]
MSGLLYRWGRVAAMRPWRVIAVWLVVVVAVLAGATGFGRELEDSFVVPGLDSQQAVDLQVAAESDRAGLTAQVVVTPRDDDTRLDVASAGRSATDELEAELADLPQVLGTTRTVSPDGRVALIRVQYPVVEQLDPVDLENLKDLVTDSPAGSQLQVEASGDLFFAFEEAPTGVGEAIGLLAAVVILLVAFGSVLAMGLPIGIALVGLTVSVSGLSLITYLVDIPSFAPVVGAMVGLGVGIDYALFVVTRHREYLAEGLHVPEAAGRAVATAGQSVIFAGGVVVIAILGLAVSGIPFMTAAGIAISVVVGTMVVAALTLLPALLGLAGHRINGLRSRRRQRQKAHVADRMWRRWGRHVSAHAWVYAVGATALLVALAAPALSLRLGFPDEGALPDSRTERQAYDLLADGFGAGVNGPLIIAVDVSSDSGVLEPLAAAVAADPGVASVAPAELNGDG